MAKETKNNILEAARDLFWLHGFASVSVDDICKNANVNKGSFYHYFESKNALIADIFDYMWETSKENLNECFAKNLSPEERIKRYSKRIYEKQKEKFLQSGKVLGCPYMSLGMESSTIDEKTRDKVKETYEKYITYLESLITDSNPERKDSKEVAEEIFSYINGVMYQARVKNDLEVISRDMEKGLLKFLTN